AVIATNQRNRAAQQEQTNRRLLYVSDMNLAQQDWETGNTRRMQELLVRHLPNPGQEDLRGFEWYYLWRLSHSDLFTLQHTGRIRTVAFSPDGKQLATAGDPDQGVKLWNAATGKELATLKGHTGIVWSVAFSPDGGKLATGSEDKTLKLWDVTTGQ